MSIKPEWYTPATEKEKDAPREFKVRGLDSLEAWDVMPELTYEDGMVISTGRGLRNALRLGLMDWKNHRDKDGNEIAFSKNALATLDPLTLQQIGTKIINKTQLTEAEAKNS